MDVCNCVYVCVCVKEQKKKADFNVGGTYMEKNT